MDKQQVFQNESIFRQEMKEVANQILAQALQLVSQQKEMKMAKVFFPQLQTLPSQLTEYLDNYTDEQLLTFIEKIEEVTQWLKTQYK